MNRYALFLWVVTAAVGCSASCGGGGKSHTDEGSSPDTGLSADISPDVATDLPTDSDLGVEDVAKDVGIDSQTDASEDVTSDNGSDFDSGAPKDVIVSLSHPTRMGQGVGVFLPRSCPTPVDLATTKVWGHHLDGVEVLVGGDWKVRDWNHDSSLPLEQRITSTSDDMAHEARYWVKTLHDQGLLAFVSINWQGSLPGVNHEEMVGDALQAYRFYKFSLETGERYEEEGFDWASATAREYALGVFTDVSTLIGPNVDWLFINELGFASNMPWYDAPVYSDAALADFKIFTGTDKGFPVDENDLPEGVELAEPELYNTSPELEDWAQWEAWRLYTFKRKIEALTEGFALGQASNPDYMGAIWFENYDAVDIESELLDTVASLPQIKYLVPENLVPSMVGDPVWDAWSTAASNHEKKMGAFAAMSGVEITSSGMTYVPKSTNRNLDRLLQYVVSEAEVSLMTMYYAGSFDPNTAVSSLSYRPGLIDVWDDWTHPNGPDADPFDWTVYDEPDTGEPEPEPEPEPEAEPEEPASVVCPDSYIVNDTDSALAISGCTIIEGDLTIGGAVLASDLCAISGVTTILGEFLVEGTTNLRNLDGLASLNSVGGTLRIYNNDALEDIVGLYSLQGVGSNLYIGYNAKLTRLKGLENLTTVTGVFIGSNTSLKSIVDLSSLAQTSYLKISNNGALQSLAGPANLVTLSDYLEVSGNNALTDLSGLSSINSVSNSVKFLNNSALCSSVINELLEGISVGDTDTGSVENSGNKDDC